MLSMNRKAKDNLYAAAPLVEGFNAVVEMFEKPSGMKSACQEAAILSFLRLTHEARLALIEEIRGAEMRGGVRTLVEKALGKEVPGKAPLRIAAKKQKPDR